VCGLVPGAVAVGEGRRESCGPFEAMTAFCLTTVRLALARLKGRSSPSSDRCRSLFRHLSGGMFLPDKGFRFPVAFFQRHFNLPRFFFGEISIFQDCFVTNKVHVLNFFDDYLHQGYYPFYKEDPEGFDERLVEVCKQVIEQDIPAVTEVVYATVQKLKKLLYIIAAQVPFIPKMEDIYAQLEVNREQGLKLMDLLERAALIGQLKTNVKAVKKMSSPDKLFLDNPNLMFALSGSPEIGTIRETFFYNQLSRVCKINYPDKGDFLVDDRYLFEVGGPKKSFNQIKDVENSFLAIDGVEFGRGNKIPLWLFGFLY
jgi:hypothetical protein